MKFNIFEQPASRSQEKRFEKHSDEYKHAARSAWEANWKQSLDDMLKAKDYGGAAMMNKNLSDVGADSMDERGFRVHKKEERQESFDAWREAELNRLKEDEERPVNN